MILARINFGKPEGGDLYEIDECASCYLYSLAKNGQICSEFLSSTHQGEVIAYVELLRPDSLAETWHSAQVRSELEKLRKFFPQKPVWEVIDDHVPKSFPELADSPHLYLFASVTSPVWCGGIGEPVPLYQLPVDERLREGLLFWSSEYRKMDGIWLSSGELERETYTQMVSLNSALTKEGRELATSVEKATRIPTFYFLIRYYGRGEAESQRPCPGCGSEWFLNWDRDGGFHQFSFRCDPCRLVSHLASSEDEGGFAAIGEF